ncbi:hypothetical protein [Geothrix mesophila]|uniref:hypothetical protein n=1 Tax=Geothrix mesophila TaxID=2922723 RepID=UPI001FACFED1|nr:hypothetical protein [Geothrix sp. SG198]
MIRLMRWREWTGVEWQKKQKWNLWKSRPVQAETRMKVDPGVRNKTIVPTLATSRVKMLDSFMNVWLIKTFEGIHPFLLKQLKLSIWINDDAPE